MPRSCIEIKMGMVWSYTQGGQQLSQTGTQVKNFKLAIKRWSENIGEISGQTGCMWQRTGWNGAG